MKQICMLTTFALMAFAGKAQNVGIGTSTPQAKLDIATTNSGVLIPRLTTAQRNAINNPAKSLLVFDSTLNQFMYYGGSGWLNLGAAGNDYWTSQLTGAETMLRSNSPTYSRVMIGEKPIQDANSYSNSPHGALTVRSKKTGVSDFVNYLTMDGQGIQARTENITILGPQFNDDLLLNRFGGAVGIGTTPQHSKLEVAGTVGASAAMFGVGKTGVSIHADNPEIGFNYYYNNGTKTMKPGFAANIGMSPFNGDLYISNFGAYTSAADWGDISSAGYRQIITIKQNRKVGIGTTMPDAKLHVEPMDEPLMPAITGVGKGYEYTQTVSQGVTYNTYDHKPGINAVANGGSAIEINGPVAIASTSKDFAFNVFPQNTNSNNLGYYFDLGNGFWAIKLTGVNSPLSDPLWPGIKFLQVTPYFVGSMAADFLLPTQSALFYSSTDGETYWVMNQSPVQTGKPIYRLTVWFVRSNPSVGVE